MSNLQDIITYYRSQATDIKRNLSIETKKIYRVGSMRLILFIAGVSGIICYRDCWWEAIVAGCIFFVPFILLIKVHNRMFDRKDYLEKALEVNEQELKAIDYDPSAFDEGACYIDPSHSFSFDIDIFGKKSLFQYVNRTVTPFGKKVLADYFIHPLDQAENIVLRQGVVRELVGKPIFRQQYRIDGLLYKGDPNDGNEIAEWEKTDNYFNKRFYYRILKWAVPFINAALILLALFQIISYVVPCFSVVFFIFCSVGLGRHIAKVQFSFDKELRVLNTYVKLLSMIERESFVNDGLIGIQQEANHDKLSASEAIGELTKFMNALDQRNNVFITALLNGLFFWELHQIMKIETWKNKYGKYLSQWLACIGEMDALCSLSTYAYNNPSFVYPVLSSVPMYKARGLKHPLMDHDKCISNDIDMEGAPRFVIITGANMAGKSTYLRTVSINHLLACMGMPVDAEEMMIYPAHLVTSLRTNDSLIENESYFFAELKRLKMIIDRLQRGEKLFIVLDEILRGTNSADKQKGSYSFIKQLVLLNATGLIATHDLQLTSLRTFFPSYIGTQCFEADIVNNELTFSYKLRNGIAQNMNACFLMKKMGIKIEE